MMKKNQLLSLFLFFIVACGPLAAQTNASGLRVMVHPLKVESKNEQIQLAAAAMRSTIELSLKLVNEFKLISHKDETSLSEALDRSVEGRCYTNSEEEIIFELTVHDLKLNKTLFNQRYKADTLFDLFDVSDKATVSLLEALTKKQVRFGSVKVTAKNPNEPFDIFLHGEKVADGRGTVSKDNIIAGTYDLHIKQLRPWGRSVIYKETVDISPDNVAAINLPEIYLLQSERDKLMVPPPSKEHGPFTSTDILYRSASGLYDLAPSISDELKKAYTEITRTMHDDTVYFPAKDAFQRYLQDSKVKYQASAQALLAFDKKSHTYLTTRTMKIDGHANDWQGIPKIEVAQRQNSASLADSTPLWWKMAVSPDGKTLYVLMNTKGGKVKKNLWYRFWINQGASESIGEKFFQMDIRPIGTHSSAACQWWSSQEPEVFHEFTLPSKNKINGHILEAAVQLKKRTFDVPMVISGEVLQGASPYTRYVKLHEQKMVPIKSPHRRSFPTLYSDSVETLKSLGGWHNKGASAGALNRINNSFQMLTSNFPQGSSSNQ